MSVAEACLGRAQSAPSQGTSCNQIRVALISGHPLYREGFARILRTAGNMAFVEGVYAADAVAIARERAADVVVIDTAAGHVSGRIKAGALPWGVAIVDVP